jgi:hypothetical protein
VVEAAKGYEYAHCPDRRLLLLADAPSLFADFSSAHHK